LVADVSKDRSVFIFRGLGPLIFVDVTTSLLKFGEDMQVGLRSVDVTPVYTASPGHACSCPVDHKSGAVGGGGGARLVIVAA
jgi:hypothetical protein